MVDVRLVRYMPVIATNSIHQMMVREQEVEFRGIAVWWKPMMPDVSEDPSLRWLGGEMHLPKGLLPSCDHPLFMIQVWKSSSRFAPKS